MKLRPLVLGLMVLVGSTVSAVPPGFVVEVLHSGLDFPVTLAFAPDGRIFYNERAGRIRVIENGVLLPTPFAEISVATSGERGLLGLAFHPQFESNGHVYVCFSDPGGGHEIGRFTAVGNLGTDYSVVVPDLPGAVFHNGGNIAFGPDGKLYHSMGDNISTSNSQSASSYPGKIHRFDDDGSIPGDNPYSTGVLSRYCMGLRNSFDLCWNEELGLLYASENGPATDDEVNLITAGANYGWPTASCAGPGFEPALTCWTPTVAPTGITAYTADAFGPEYLHDLFVGDFGGGRIWHIDLTPDGQEFVSRETFHDGPTGVLDVVTGPDGHLYYTTSTQILRIRRVTDELVRGDVDANQIVDGLVDALFLLDFGFSQGDAPPCRDAADVDDDGTVNALVDGYYLLLFFFLNGPPPPLPYPGCGPDPTDDPVGCDLYPGCP